MAHSTGLIMAHSTGLIISYSTGLIIFHYAGLIISHSTGLITFCQSLWRQKLARMLKIGFMVRFNLLS
jgi:hypothetical protein